MPEGPRRCSATPPSSAVGRPWPHSLDEDAVLARWATGEPELAGLTSVAELLAVWFEDGGSDRTNALLATLVRLAAVDGGHDNDALLLTLHLLSGLVWATVAKLRDLSPDIVAVVVGELACQIGAIPGGGVRARSPRTWERRRDGRCSPSCGPRVRRHPDRGEFLTHDGDVSRLAQATICDDGEDNLDVVDLLRWAVRSGVDAADVALLVATECGRDLCERGAALRVAAAHGITKRTLYRRRNRRSQLSATWRRSTWRPSRDRVYARVRYGRWRGAQSGDVESTLRTLSVAEIQQVLREVQARSFQRASRPLDSSPRGPEEGGFQQDAGQERADPVRTTSEKREVRHARPRPG